MPSIREIIVKADHTVWYYLNTQWHNAFLDAVIPYVRNQYFWAPLYLFLLIFIPYKFGKRGWFWCGFYLVAFTIADQMAVNVIKPFFHRIRPCSHPELKKIVHLLVECGSGLSFPSAHASNHFAMGIFCAVTLGRSAKWVWPVAIAWALLVAYAQVYVGVHFPFDVMFGGVLGTTIGIAIGKVYNGYFDLQSPPKVRN